MADVKNLEKQVKNNMQSNALQNAAIKEFFYSSEVLEVLDYYRINFKDKYSIRIIPQDDSVIAEIAVYYYPKYSLKFAIPEIVRLFKQKFNKKILVIFRGIINDRHGRKQVNNK